MTDFSIVECCTSNVAETPIISAPAAARPSAIANPIPLLQPVTKATFPVKLKIGNIYNYFRSNGLTLSMSLYSRFSPPIPQINE